MAGYFYPPPPSRIGGNQPYAPKLGIAQSGPTPDAPPIRGPLALATLALVVSSWTPQPVRAQTSASIAPLIPAVVVSTQVPFSQQAQLKTIYDAWTASSVVVLGGSQVAPLLATPPTIDNPPPSTNINFNVLVRSWQPLPYLIEGAENIAPLVPTQVAVANPVYDRQTIIRSIIDSWQPKQWPVQYRPFVASLPIVDSPPIVSRALYRSIIQSWAQQPYLIEGQENVAPLISTPVQSFVPYVSLQSFLVSQWQPIQWPQQIRPFTASLPIVNDPPRSSQVNAQTVLNSWIPPWMPPQGFTRIAPTLPRNDSPPVRTLINYELIGRQWQPRWTGPDQVKFAPLAPPPPVISPPPRKTHQTLTLIVNRWVPPYFYVQASADFAPLVPVVGYVEDTRVIVPYLIGSTAAHATQQLASVHLLVSTIGITGTVTAQDVAAFSLVARGTTVTITLGGSSNNPPRGGRGLPNYTLPN